MKGKIFRWNCIIRVAVLGLIAFAFSGFFYNPSWHEISRKFVESLIYLIFYILLFSVRPIYQYFAKIPRPHKLVFFIFFILLLIGQIVNQPRLTFPFTSWAMYGRPEHPERLVFYQYRGLNGKQERIVISPEELLPTIGKSVIASKFRILIHTSFSEENGAERNENREKLKELLLSIGQIYNRRYPEDPIHTVEIIQCSIDLSDRGHINIIRKSLWQFELNDRRL